MAKAFNVLLIEDEKFDQDFFKRSLSDCPFETNIIVRSTIQDGINEIRKNSFDVIFTDFRLPDGDCFTLFSGLREHDLHVPVIVVSSKIDEIIVEDLLKAGATDYIPKDLLTSSGLSIIIPSTIRYHKLFKEKAMVRKEYQVIEQTLKSTLKTFEIFIFVTDKEGVLQLVEGKKLINTKLAQKSGSSAFEVFKEHVGFLSYLKSALRGKKVANTIIQGDRFLEVSCVPIKKDNILTGVYGFVEDATERYTIQHSLIEAKEFAEKSAMVKERFLANMSHEIRTPMNAIVGFTDLLLDRDMDREEFTYMSSIRQAGENLLILLDDILDYTKMDSGNLVILNKPFNLRELMNNVQQVMKPQAEKKGIGFVMELANDLPNNLEGDSVRLNQVLINLIGNAIKFTKRGYVKILISSKDIDPKKVQLFFEIQDTGIGIALDKQKLIFQSFTQARDDTSREFGGTGLGLAIVKKIIELLNGNIKLTSEFGLGSSFFFDLEYNKSANRIGVMRDIIDKAHYLFNAERILLVEDNKMNQLLTTTHLEGWGLETVVAENGKQAIDLLGKGNFDCVLMDIQMPIMNGFEATEEIRRSKKGFSSIPIIAMTAHAFTEERMKCIRVGMDNYISKPYRTDNLKAIIFNTLNSGAGELLNESNDAIKIEQSDRLFKPEILIDITNDNKDLMIDLIKIYMITSNETLHSMEECLKELNFDNLRSIAHKFLNSASTVGLPVLAKNLTVILYDDYIVKNVENLTAHLQTIGVQIRQSQVELREYLRETH